MQDMKPTTHYQMGVRRASGDSIISTRTYSNFLYKVTMDHDGAIHVKHGDWLSKYSAALYNNFKGINQFGRLDRSGTLRPIQNPNLIHTGETIYHIPTYKHAHPLVGETMVISAVPLTDQQTARVIRDMVQQDFDLHGENLETLHKVAESVHAVDSAAFVLEVAGILAEGVAAVTVLQLVNALLTPIALGIAVANANDTDRRLAGQQAIGYTLTAWAFDDPLPSYPSSLIANFSSFPGKQDLPRVEAAWNESSEATVRNLEKESVKKGRHKESLQLVWKSVGDFDRKTLARRVMEGVAEEISEAGVERDSFWGLDPDRYPN